MEILQGHISPETAYLVKDYPYGYTLRCQIRYWLEFKPGHGVRLVSQTSNPKRGHVWNKPKAGTYCRFGGCMVLMENQHVICWLGRILVRGGGQGLVRPLPRRMPPGGPARS